MFELATDLELMPDDEVPDKIVDLMKKTKFCSRLRRMQHKLCDLALLLPNDATRDV